MVCAGHIGYSIKKAFRSKGYGTKGLGMVLDVAREIVPEDEIYLRVLKSNIPSFKAISNNGAYIVDEDETPYLMRVKK
ncbi:MAG: GNAT family N-acetyltransferase [Lachnospiraceae bacterium]|nr:GNAT family N-acetyltransferase [Lachnospiraceae bacterium]